MTARSRDLTVRILKLMGSGSVPRRGSPRGKVGAVIGRRSPAQREGGVNHERAGGTLFQAQAVAFCAEAPLRARIG